MFYMEITWPLTSSLNYFLSNAPPLPLAEITGQSSVWKYTGYKILTLYNWKIIATRIPDPITK